jgi:Bacterial PH domain
MFFPLVQHQLTSDERLLWSGQPRKGLTLRASDALAIPFSLMWGGFAIFWEYSVATTGTPFFFKLWGVPFVLVGLYMIVGRFFYDAQARAKTYYAVTDSRILIISGIFSQQIKSLSLNTLADISLAEGAGGEGTITFGNGQSNGSPFGRSRSWPGSQRYSPPCFELIPRAKSVYDLIREAKQSKR